MMPVPVLVDLNPEQPMKAERLVIDTNALNSAQNFGLMDILPAIWTIHGDI